MEKALVSLAQKNEAEAAASKETMSPQQPAAPQTPAAPVPAALKGVSQSLLDRVKKPFKMFDFLGFEVC